MQKKIFITKIKNNLSEAIFNGLEWIDYKNLIPKNSRIVIKPNFTYPAYKQGVTVCPETIEKTVSILSSLTNDITIVESNGGRNAWQAEEAFEGHGLLPIQKQYGIKLVNLTKCETKPMNFKAGKTDYCIPLPKLLLDETDVFINLCIPKIHCMTGITLSLKNLWGCVPDVNRLFHHHVFNYAICAINNAIKPKIIIGDAMYMLNRNGPMYGDPVKMNTIIVSNDVGSFELACCDFMSTNLNKITHLKTARKLGIVPENLNEVKLNITEIPKNKFYLKRTLRNWIVLTAFNSRIINWLFYGPSIGKILHDILYFFNKPDHLKVKDTGEGA